MFFTGWVRGDDELAATVTHLVGTKATLVVYTLTGGTTVAYMVPYDASGQTPGSWRLRD